MNADERVFIDTNVLVYLQSIDDEPKRAQAEKIVNAYRDAIISTQVLNELASVLVKKKKVQPGKVHSIITGTAGAFYVREINVSTIVAALALMEETGSQIAYYDSLIVCSALEAGCSLLFTEDMTDGMVVRGKLKIINPFRAGSADL